MARLGLGETPTGVKSAPKTVLTWPPGCDEARLRRPPRARLPGSRRPPPPPSASDAAPLSAFSAETRPARLLAPPPPPPPPWGSDVTARSTLRHRRAPVLRELHGGCRLRWRVTLGPLCRARRYRAGVAGTTRSGSPIADPGAAWRLRRVGSARRRRDTEAGERGTPAESAFWAPLRAVTRAPIDPCAFLSTNASSLKLRPDTSRCHLRLAIAFPAHRGRSRPFACSADPEATHHRLPPPPPPAPAPSDFCGLIPTVALPSDHYRLFLDLSDKRVDLGRGRPSPLGTRDGGFQDAVLGPWGLRYRLLRHPNILLRCHEYGPPQDSKS